MNTYTHWGLLASAVMVYFRFLDPGVMAEVADTEPFRYEFLDTDKTILKLMCHGGCSTEMKASSISIYNTTSMTKMAVVTANRASVVSTPPGGVSYFVAGGISEASKSCHLDLVITNYKNLRDRQFGCNVSHLNDVNGDMAFKLHLLTVDIRDDHTEGSAATTRQDTNHNISTTTLTILIVVIIILFFLAVIFFSMWIRGFCYRRKSCLQHISSDGDMTNSHFYSGDTTSVVSFARSSSKVMDRRESEFQSPVRTASIRKKTTPNETYVGSSTRFEPPLPLSPPGNVYWKGNNNIHRAPSNIKVPCTYTSPQDAIDPDFGEDGDVTSSNDGVTPIYSQAWRSCDIQPSTGLYSSVPVHSAEVVC